MGGHEDGSNSTDEMKLSYDDMCDMILAEDLNIEGSREFFGMGLALSVDDQGQGLVRSRNRNWGSSKLRSD